MNTLIKQHQFNQCQAIIDRAKKINELRNDVIKSIRGSNHFSSTASIQLLSLPGMKDDGKFSVNGLIHNFKYKFACGSESISYKATKTLRTGEIMLTGAE